MRSPASVFVSGWASTLSYQAGFVFALGHRKDEAPLVSAMYIKGFDARPAAAGRMVRGRSGGAALKFPPTGLRFAAELGDAATSADVDGHRLQRAAALTLQSAAAT
jgi:hypothetical protein